MYHVRLNRLRFPFLQYSGPPSRRSGGRPIQDGGASQGSPGKLIDTDDPDKEAAQLVGPDPAQAGSPSPTQKKLDLQDDIELSDPASDREIVGSSNLSGRGKRRRKVTWKIREGFDTKTRSNILSDNVGQRKQRKLNAASKCRSLSHADGDQFSAAVLQLTFKGTGWMQRRNQMAALDLLIRMNRTSNRVSQWRDPKSRRSRYATTQYHSATIVDFTFSRNPSKKKCCRRGLFQMTKSQSRTTRNRYPVWD